VFLSSITPDFFETYDPKSNEFTATAESIVFECVRRLYDCFQVPPTIDILSSELHLQEKGLDFEAKELINELLVEISEWSANPNETAYLIKEVTNFHRERKLKYIQLTTLKANEDKGLDYAIKYNLDAISRLSKLNAEPLDPAKSPLSMKEAISYVGNKLEAGKPIIEICSLYNFPMLDQRLDGIARKEYLLLGGSSHVGKSFVAAHLGYVAAEAGRSVAMASAEMTTEQMLIRLLARETLIPSRKINHPELLSPDEVDAISTAYERLAEYNIHFFPKGSFHTIEGLKALILHKLGDGQLDMVVLDYIDKLQASKARNIQIWETKLMVSDEFQSWINQDNISGISPTQNNALGMKNKGFGADESAIAFKQLFKDCDSFLMLSEDPENPYIKPEHLTEVGTPGILLVNVLKHRITGAGGDVIPISVEFATAQLSGATVVERKKTTTSRAKRKELKPVNADEADIRDD
jgi:replicative DNA helicase